MKKFEGILLCTDLDGTLYSSDKSVSQKNLDAIEYFKSEGGLFTFITGRVPLISKDICRITKPNAPFGCSNGGAIYDHVRDQYLWYLTLDRDAMELVRAVDEQLPEIGIQLNTEQNIYFCKNNSATARFRAITGIPDIYADYMQNEEPLLKVLFADSDPKNIERLACLLDSLPGAEKYDFIRSEATLYEIMPKGASKGGALLKLCELLSIDPRRTVAVGDYYNDISMIRAAGAGFAVANAVDEAKRVADHITVSNNEGAIGDIIERLDRGKLKL